MGSFGSKIFSFAKPISSNVVSNLLPIGLKFLDKLPIPGLRDIG
jgi:hypothetical protein